MFNVPSLNRCRYCTSTAGPLSAARIGVIVASLDRSIAQKYGTSTNGPRFLLTPIEGISTPLARFSDGSGWVRYGNHATGTPYRSITASRYSMRLLAMSCTAERARISHNGALSGWAAHRSHVV